MFPHHHEQSTIRLLSKRHKISKSKKELVLFYSNNLQHNDKLLLSNIIVQTLKCNENRQKFRLLHS